MARIDEHDAPGAADAPPDRRTLRLLVCEQFCDRYAFGLITRLRESPFEKGDISALNALFHWLPLH